MYTSLLRNQTIILSNGTPQKSTKMDVAAIQDIDMGTRQGVVLLDGNFRNVSQEQGEEGWILRVESNLFTSEYTPVQSNTDGLTVPSTESEQCANV